MPGACGGGGVQGLSDGHDSRTAQLHSPGSAALLAVERTLSAAVNRRYRLPLHAAFTKRLPFPLTCYHCCMHLLASCFKFLAPPRGLPLHRSPVLLPLPSLITVIHDRSMGTGPQRVTQRGEAEEASRRRCSRRALPRAPTMSRPAAGRRCACQASAFLPAAAGTVEGGDENTREGETV